MSEVINNSRIRIENIKTLIKDIHNGINVENKRNKLVDVFGKVPHGEVVIAEQELLEEGLPEEEIIRHCDLHSNALKGALENDTGIDIPAGHPIDVFINENKAVNRRIENFRRIVDGLKLKMEEADTSPVLLKLKQIFNDLADLEKHYSRKENLLFPFLEKNNISGPPMVMWAKDDEVRSFIRSSNEALKSINEISAGDLLGISEMLLATTINAVEEMIYKEEKILLPMSFDTLTENEWHQIYLESPEIGYCLVAPKDEWKPEGLVSTRSEKTNEGDRIKLSTGSFSKDELESVFKTLGVDLTFVDKDDTVKFFSEGEDRIFVRSRAIIGRKVQNCHPPSSVHIVEKILDDFKAGREDKASFWIDFHGKFVHIEYFALKGDNGEYLGTLEVTQDIKRYRELTGERRILNYEN